MINNNYFALSFENISGDKKFWLNMYKIHHFVHSVGMRDDTEDNRLELKEKCK